MKNNQYYRDPKINCESDLIYIPSDDTYLITDFIKEKLNTNSFDDIKLENIKNVLDMGTGSGIIPILLLIIKKENRNFKANIYASDISEVVLKCAKNNELLNGFNSQINFIHSDLFDSFPNSLFSKFDIIFFNPPYLPLLDDSEFPKNEKDLCWDGGKGGIEIFIRFLNNVKEFLNLTHKGCIYYISSSRADQNTLERINKEKGFINKIIEKKHFFFEDIFLNKLVLSKI
ncbi:MAG: methyltransferase domain-containing protein [Candidatus Lokiarchaeota archaeon]|nr:methyltransferase domain-containing protein [Candidatus Lokiarchaeota archaeon]